MFLGLSEKELKKLAKAAEKEVKVEVPDTNTDETLENTATEDGVQALEENAENQDGTSNINKEKTFWIEYDDFWKCFGLVTCQKLMGGVRTLTYLVCRNCIKTFEFDCTC